MLGDSALYVEPFYRTLQGNCYSACIYCRSPTPESARDDDLQLLTVIQLAGWYLVPGEGVTWHPVCPRCYSDLRNLWAGAPVSEVAWRRDRSS